MSKTPAPEKKRRTISPAEKAQQALDVIDRQIEAVTKRIKAKEAEVEAVKAELPPLERRREYAAANPDLPPHQQDEKAEAGTGG